MTHKIQAIRGMNDVLPEETPKWQYLLKKLSGCLAQYGYQQIEFPLVECTNLFKRTIGEVTDIVEKEMYTFQDLNGDSLTLRPEGTAGCVRACLEHGLLHNQTQKLWYYGPMFRHEKPQKGRYRQFYQIGVESFGFSGVGVELELIAMTKRMLQKLGLLGDVSLEINSIGDSDDRKYYRELLVKYFNENYDALDEESKNRLSRNPLRILDSKNPAMTLLIKNAPKMIDVLSEKSREHFNQLCTELAGLDINYTVNPKLVRGLDYYGHTVFEWVTNRLGSQSTVCAGGRYDKLVEQLGGRSTPAVGFALGIERLLLLQEVVGAKQSDDTQKTVYFIPAGKGALTCSLQLAEQIRDKISSLNVVVNAAGGSFKSQFKKADKSGAKFALILGDDELSEGTIGVKDLRNQSEQQVVRQDELCSFLQAFFDVGDK